MSSQADAGEIIMSKSANIMTEFGELSTLAKTATILSGEVLTLAVYEALKQFYGGTWVGGTATLTTTQLSFRPSALNFLLPGGKDPSVTLPLKTITNAVMDGGLIMKILRIDAPGLTVRLRCYGAANFLQKIRDGAKLI